MALLEYTSSSKITEQLDAYKSACEDHPNLRSFDSLLQQRAKNLISFTTQTGMLSQNAIHTKAIKAIPAVCQNVADYIVKCDGVGENKAIRSLVQTFFDMCLMTLEIFEEVMKCVEKAEMGQLIIQQAVDIESAESDVGGKKKKYKKTLKKLKEFKAMGDPFNGRELTTQFELAKKQQESLLEKVSELIGKVKGKKAKLKNWIQISNVVLAAAIFCAAVPSIALMATGVAAEIAFPSLSLATFIVMGWNKFHTTLVKRLNALKRQKENLVSIESGTRTNRNEMESVSGHVRWLEARISFILEFVDKASESEEDEKATRDALNTIREKVEELTEKLKDVGKAASRSTKLIVEARYQVAEKIICSA